MSRKKREEASEPAEPVRDVEGAVAPDALEGALAEPPPSTVPTNDVDVQLAEQKEKYLRLAAEYDNYRKRSTKERLEMGSRAQAEIVSKLIDALDDLSRFADIDPATTDPMTLHKGIEMVEAKVSKSLSAAGLELINPVDLTFDPTVHEAVSTEPALSKEDDDTVSKVFQVGYRFNGQLLRPARVVVKQWNG